MAESRLTTAFQNLDASPFDGFMTARLLIPIETTADAQSYVPQEFDFQVVAGQAYNDYNTLELATLPHTSSGACNPGNTPISIYTKDSNGRKTYYKSVIIPPETGAVPVVLTSLVAVEPDSEVAYTNVTNLTPRGVWAGGTAYVLGDTVTYAGSTYWANQASTGQTPSVVSVYWNQLIEGIEPTLASTTAASAAALGDFFHTVQSGPVIRKVTNQQVFNLLDDQPMTWTAAQTFGAAPTVYTSYNVGGRTEYTSTSSTRATAAFEAVANPSGSSTGLFTGVWGYAEVKSGNVQNLTGAVTAPGLIGVRGQVSHAGTGTVTSAVSIFSGGISNSGGGIITAAYGLYLAAQTAGATNWGVYQAGTAKNRLSGITGIGMDPVNTLDVTGTFGVTGKSYIEAPATTSSAHTFGVRTEKTTTAYGTISEMVGNPASAASNVWVGILGEAETKAGNTFGSTNSLALRGVSGTAEHKGTGTVAGAAALSALNIANTGGGTITNAYGVHIASQSAGVNNWGLYQAGTSENNYFGGKVGIGTITPDSVVSLDLRQTGTQLAFGGAAKSGYAGANTTAGGSFFGFRAIHDNTNWVAKSTAAAFYLVTNAGHKWYIDSGLVDGNTFTPTPVMDLVAFTGGATLWVAGNTTLLGSNTYAIGASPIYTNTTNTRIAGKFEAMSNPSADGTQIILGTVSYAASTAGNVFNYTSTVAGLRGGNFRVFHKGSGIVTGMAGAVVETPVNDGGGTVTNNYALYINAQTAAGITNGWGVYQVGSSTNNYFAGDVGIGGLPSGTYPLEVTGTSYFSGAALFSGVPIVATAYAIGARRETTSTGSAQPSILGEMVGNPSGSSTASYAGVFGLAETKSGNAQNLTSIAGIVGVRARVSHLGSGVVTGAAGVYIDAPINSGGGTITDLYGIYQNGTEKNVFNGDIYVGTAGKGLRIKEGSNAKMGQSVLVGGTVTIANTGVTANSRIFITRGVAGGTRGMLEVGTITPGTSFVIRSTDSAGSLVADTSTINWQIVEPA